MNRATTKRLKRIFGKDGFDVSPVELMFYEYDASLDRGQPDAVVFPETTAQVVELVKLAGELGISLTARGAGTNLSGGSVPIDGGIVVEFCKMKRILDVDPANLRAVVQPGVVNLELNMALAKHGCFYAPDPASQRVSTMGGNIAENAGGPHCLKYGVTTNHVLGLEVVLSDGSVARLGGPALDTPGYDLTGAFVGSEGTFGLVTEITVRIMRKPETVKTMLAIFDKIEDAADTVSAIIAAGIVPTTLEMMDQAATQAVEESFNCGYPMDAEAVLIIEADGAKANVEREAAGIEEICRAHGVRDIQVAKDAAEAEALWRGRKGVLSALARISPYYLALDGTVPRTKLPEVLRKVIEIGKRRGFRVANVLHAGDGNLHPFISLDDPSQAHAGLEAGFEMLQACVDAGGTISGEHGIGLEKRDAMPFVFSDDDLAMMKAVRDVFDPNGMMNPKKIFA